MIDDIKVIESKKNKLVLEIYGDKHTLPNVIVDELYNDKEVKAASYFNVQPLKNISRLIIETKGKDPKQALLDAISRLKRKYSSIGSMIDKI